MDWDGPGIGNFGGFNLIGQVVHGLLWLLILLVTIAILFLLIRFLLIATKAAQIYNSKNRPEPPPGPVPGSTVPPAAPATSSVVPPTQPLPPTPPVPPTEPRPRATRTPKTPPPATP